MMIDPKIYRKTFIDGKTPPEILKEIAELKRTITRCKKIMHNAKTKQIPEDRPSSDVVLDCTRQYLTKAEEAYEEAGGTYEIRGIELRGRRFNEKLKDCKRIIYHAYAYPMCTKKRIYKEEDGAVVVETDWEATKAKGQKLKTTGSRFRTWKGLIDKLKLQYIGEWRQYYDNTHIDDGCGWSLEFQDSKGKTIAHFAGSNDGPGNLEEVLLCLGIKDSFFPFPGKKLW